MVLLRVLRVLRGFTKGLSDPVASFRLVLQKETPRVHSGIQRSTELFTESPVNLFYTSLCLDKVTH